jgi:hypothetical protein
MKSKKLVTTFAITFIALSIFLVAAASSGYYGQNDSNHTDQNQTVPTPYPIPVPYPIKITGNFIMWSNDGKNLMWGTYSVKLIYPCICKPCDIINYICYPCDCSIDSKPYYNGTFEGKDNQGNTLKGNFLRNTFSGYYTNNNGDYMKRIFSGKFDNGYWKAIGLFGQKESSGEYKFFPNQIPMPYK